MNAKNNNNICSSDKGIVDALNNDIEYARKLAKKAEVTQMYREKWAQFQAQHPDAERHVIIWRDGHYIALVDKTRAFEVKLDVDGEAMTCLETSRINLRQIWEGRKKKGGKVLG